MMRMRLQLYSPHTKTPTASILVIVTSHVMTASAPRVNERCAAELGDLLGAGDTLVPDALPLELESEELPALFAGGVVLNTRMYEISKYAWSKLVGSCTRSRHVPFPTPLQVCTYTGGLPAKSPQIVVSRMSD